MRKHIYILSLLLIGIGAMSQNYVNQIIVGNGGIYGNDNDHVTLTGIDPENYSSEYIGEVIRESVQDIVIHEGIAYVAAEDSLVKFDLVNHTKQMSVFQPNLSRLLFDPSNGRLFVSLRSDLNGPPAGGIYLKVFDSELNELYSTNQISNDAAGMYLKADSLYIAVPGDWQASEGKFAVATNDLSYVREENWGVDAVGINDIYNEGHHIYTVNKSPYGANTGSVSHYDIFTGLHNTQIIQSIVGKGVAKDGQILYLGIDYGIGSFDLNSFQIIDSEIIPDPGSSNYINIAAAVYDWINEKFYVTTTDYFSFGAGTVYDRQGNEIGSFDADVSAEAMAIFFEVEYGMEEMNNISMNVFPNPSNNRIYIDIEKPIMGLAIYNLKGQLVQNSDHIVSNTYDISPLKTGIYILKIKTNDGFGLHKLIKN